MLRRREGVVLTAAGILTLLAGIERHGIESPAGLAFQSAITRAGREAVAAGGPDALDTLTAAVAAADPDMAEHRTMILDGLWEDIGMDGVGAG